MVWSRTCRKRKNAMPRTVRKGGAMPRYEIKGHEVLVDGEKQFLHKEGKLFKIRDRWANDDYESEEDWEFEKWQGSPADSNHQKLFEEWTEERLEEESKEQQHVENTLEEQIKTCKKQCQEMEKQLKVLQNKETFPFELKKSEPLVHLLTTIVLHPGHDWKERIQTLIEIPHDVKSEKRDRTSGPSYFEALFQLAFYLGLFPDIANTTRLFRNKNGIIEGNFLYTKTVNNQGGDEQGISDITFSLSSDGTQKGPGSYSCGQIPKKQTYNASMTYFISVKRYTSEKSIKYYDIGDLFTYIAKTYPTIAQENKFQLCVCVKDKEDFLRKMFSSKSEYLMLSANKIYGFKTDLIQALESYRTMVFSNIGGESISPEQVAEWVARMYPETRQVKQPLSLYFHQELIANACLQRIEEDPQNRFLCIGVLPRGGKSYIAGGILKELVRKKRENAPFWVLFMTSAINETRSQFEEDLIRKFADFDSFEFIDLVQLKDPKTMDPKKKHKFVFVSRELLTTKAKKSDEKDMHIGEKELRSVLARIGNPDIDAVFFDEAHKGGITNKTKQTIDAVFRKTIPILFMTATYKKLLSENGFIRREKDMFIWDLDDIEIMKRLPKLGLESFVEGELEEENRRRPYSIFNRYDPATIKGILKRKLACGETLERISQPYQQFPMAYFLSASFASETVQELLGGSDGFDMKDHFKVDLANSDTVRLLNDITRYDEWHRALMNPQKAIALRSFLTPNDKEYPLIDEKTKILNRMFAVAQTSMGAFARPRYGTPFSILMFMPTGGKGTDIGASCRAWGSLLLQSTYWREHFIVLGLSQYKQRHIKMPRETKKPDPVPDADEREEEIYDAEGGYQLTTLVGGAPKHHKCTVENPVSKEYDMYCSEENLEGKDLKQKIQSIERKALELGKGLVILTGQRATMGISLPCVDLVCMLDTDTEADAIIQKMYRALTDSPGKRYGFIFDLNVRRIFRAKYEYAIEKNRTAKGKHRMTATELMENEYNCSLWDTDAWITKNQGRNFNDYMKEIRDTLFGNLKKELFGSFEKDVLQTDLLSMDVQALTSMSDIVAILKGGTLVQTSTNPHEFQKPDETVPPKPPQKGDDSNSCKNEEGEADSESCEKDIEDEKTVQTSKEFLVSLTKEFVNRLFLRSDGLNTDLESLLRFFDKAKGTYTGSSENGCQMTNIYGSIVSEMMAYLPTPKVGCSKKGSCFVGPVKGKRGDKDMERYEKIPIGTELNYKGHIAYYHPWANTTINKWLVSIHGEMKEKGERTTITGNVFRIVKVKDDSLGEFIDSIDEADVEEVSSLSEEMKQRSIAVVDFIRSRFGNPEEERNDVFLIYSNYVESFMDSIQSQSLTTQTGGEIARYNRILKVIHEHLVPERTAKDERGEVFTPPKVVREMLFGLSKKSQDDIPTIWGLDKEGMFTNAAEDDRIGGLPTEVWRDPTKKWLDPANGIGNFPIIAFYKLDYELQRNPSFVKKYPNDTDRHIYIIEKMLFMMELDKGNVNTCKKLFKLICPTARPNIFCGDSLSVTDEILTKMNWPTKFDIVMGNPPFNAGGSLKGGGALWPKFVYYAFHVMNPDGYIVFIHPPGWRKFYDPEERDNQGKLWYTIRENGWSLEYINVNDRPPAHFPIVDNYVIKAGSSAKKTDYTSLFMTIKNSGTSTFTQDFIPNMINSHTQSIIKKLFSMKGDDIHIIRNQSFQATTKDEGNKGVPHYHFIDKNGNKKFYNKSYASIPEYINQQKVIMTFKAGYEKGRLFAFYSSDKIGTTANSMYMLVDSKAEGERIAKFLNSDVITFLLKITQYSAPPNHINEFKILNQLKVPKSMNDYELSEDELGVIEKIVNANTNVIPKTRKSKATGGKFNRTRRSRRF